MLAFPQATPLAHRKGTVPSQATCVPSKRMMMSSGRAARASGEVGQMLRMSTPFSGAFRP